MCERLEEKASESSSEIRAQECLNLHSGAPTTPLGKQRVIYAHDGIFGTTRTSTRRL